jgi:tetratricopeptide (TPR) repeat protein
VSLLDQGLDMDMHTSNIMRQIVGFFCIALTALLPSILFAQEKEAPKASTEETMDALVEKDIAAMKQDNRKIPEKPAEATRDALGKKEAELQKAKAEVTRLRDWIVTLKEASIRERVTMSYNMGCIYRASKQYKEAEKEFLAALALDPNDRWTHYNLGILYDEDLKDKTKAQLHYQKFVDLSPDDKDKAVVQEWLSSVQ